MRIRYEQGVGWTPSLKFERRLPGRGFTKFVGSEQLFELLRFALYVEPKVRVRIKEFGLDNFFWGSFFLCNCVR